KRSDIWSFGCVLYEMLTGKVSFKGETISDTLANILQTEPQWQALPESTPANIRSLLRHCLKKDPRRRLQHMGDAGIEIDETLSSLTVSVATVEKMRPLGLRRLMVWAVACLLVGAVAASLITWNLKRSAPLSQSAKRYIIRPETDLAQEALWHHALALSPDGRRLAYVEEGSDARRKIYLRELDEFEAKPLPGTEGAISPFFSPDGQWVGYADHHQRKLKKVSIKGGQPIVLCETINFRGGTWGADGTIIFTPVPREGLWRISASGERLEQLTVPDPNQGEWGHLWPQILPDGKAVLFTNVRRALGENQIEVYRLETGKRHVLFKRGTYARYVPTGHIVYARTGTLYAVRFDVEQLKVVGSGVPVVPNVITSEELSESAQFAISRNGSLTYIPVVTRSSELTPVWVDREGRVESLPAATARNYGIVTISPNGKRLAFDIQDGDNWDVWIYDLTRHTLNPLTSNGISDNPIWTPDNKWVVFRLYQAGKVQLCRQSVTGSGKPELLATFEDFRVWPTCCSPDGKELLLITIDPKRPMLDNDISVVPFEKQSEKPHLRPFTQRNNNQRIGQWSPDGRWVAYTSDESGRWEVYVEPYPGPGPKTMISTTGGYEPAWSRDGKELFYRGGRGSPKMIAATIETEPEFRVIEYKELFETNYRDYDVAPDGRFLIIQEPQEPTPLGINIVLNWFEELKRLVPPGTD
ncbi:MAG: protein kinase, partial [Anaerolineales bacterium]|nr:protein kinase [Anaerolineales bacterium]